jgi:hypothetical protein
LRYIVFDVHPPKEEDGGEFAGAPKKRIASAEMACLPKQRCRAEPFRVPLCGPQGDAAFLWPERTWMRRICSRFLKRHLTVFLI